MTFDQRPQEAKTLLQHVRVVTDELQRDSLLQSLTHPAKPLIVSFLNAHGFNLAWDDAVIADYFRGSDILLRDGVGVSVMMRALAIPNGINMNGTDFIPMILQSFSGRNVALCGTVEPYLGKSAKAATQHGANVVLTMDGFAELAAYVQAIGQSSADLVILGMGMPKQEAVAIEIARHAQRPIVIVNGGAILDFWADRFPRAPMIWQRLRLEWLFRLMQEPKRLWRRYLLGGVIFASRILRLHLHPRKAGN